MTHRFIHICFDPTYDDSDELATVGSTTILDMGETKVQFVGPGINIQYPLAKIKSVTIQKVDYGD